jgi:peptidoglycan/LPS O-acetylase OafA/YrhL
MDGNDCAAIRSSRVIVEGGTREISFGGEDRAAGVSPDVELAPVGQLRSAQALISPAWRKESANLDFLRTVAVLSVLLFHLLRALVIHVPLLEAIGQWGVLVFFVHTTMVLMLSLERDSQTASRWSTKTHQFVSFMVRRCFRIFPASIVVVLAVCLLKLPVCHTDEQSGWFWGVQLDRAVVVSNLLLVQNLTHQASVVGTLWSLPYELQMYLVLPFLFWFGRRLALGWLIVAWAGVALVVSVLPDSAMKVWDMPRYVPCFLAGFLAYKVSCLRKPSLPPWLWPLTVVAITTGFLAVRMFRPGMKTGWVGCLSLGLLLPLMREIPRALHAPCRVIARYSYGIYLVHYITLWLAFQRLAVLSRGGQWAIFATSTAGLAVLMYHAVEQPMIRLGSRLVARHAPHTSLAYR